MRNVRLLGLALVGAVVISGVASASALAWEFESSPSGSVSVEKSSSGSQKFKITAAKAITVTCTTKSVSGMENLPAPTAEETVEFEKCSGFGSGTKVSKGEFEFKNGGSCTGMNMLMTGDIGCTGTVKVKNTIKVTVTNGDCEVVVAPTGNSNLSTMTFGTTETSPTMIKSEANVSSITWSGSETSGGCADVIAASGTGTAGSSNGTYTGENTVKATVSTTGLKV